MFSISLSAETQSLSPKQATVAKKKRREKACPPKPPADGQQGKGGGEGMITPALLLFIDPEARLQTSDSVT